MIRTFSPKTLAHQFKEGSFGKIEAVVYLDAPAVEGLLPVIWITDMDGKKEFAIRQSHACVNRGSGKVGEAWHVKINRFGEFFLNRKDVRTNDCLNEYPILEEIVLTMKVRCASCGGITPANVGVAQVICEHCGRIYDIHYDNSRCVACPQISCQQRDGKT